MNPKDISEQAKTIEHEHHLPIYRRYPITLEKGKGALVWDYEGNEYLDMLAGIAVNNTGHCHPNVVKAIQEQAEKLIHPSNFFYTKPQSDLAKLLSDLSGLERVFFCNSGVEALEAALKIARKYGNNHNKKGDIIAVERGFHGRSLAAIALGKPKYQKGFAPIPPGFKTIPFNDIEALEAEINDETIAFACEPIQGEGGIHEVSGDYLRRARELCDKHNALLFFDEVQCGNGRTGKYFGFEHHGVKPDMIATAKGLGGGFPIGAVMANEKAAQALDYGDHGTTYGGNPLACAASLAAVRTILDEDLMTQATEKGAYLIKQVKEKTKGTDYIKEIRGKGLMIGIELNFPGKPVVMDMLDLFVIANVTMDTTIRLVPPLVITYKQIDRFVNVFVDVLEKHA
ncbi:aspartate aminotransferase family protein [Rhodohalobacter sp. 8-1]|uniref:aspartate aminotransferase family protein n=1 Tax=Rhodohalobacter sp. 8-1 TaxID=3131972 RepID=UPI0030ED602E